MRGWKWGGLALAFWVLAGAAFSESREMEERRLVTSLALDKGEEGYTATAVMGARASEDEEPQAVTGEGESLAAACASLKEKDAKQAYLGQTARLLVGEGLDLSEVLDFVVAHRELRTDTTLYITAGKAGEAMAESAKASGAGQGGRDPRGKTVGEILPRLTEGETVLIPALSANEEGMLAPAGWAVAGPGGLLGTLEGQVALGAELLAGGGVGRIITLPGGAAELTGVRTWARGGAVGCALTARVVQGDPREELLALWGEEAVRAALAPGWDCWGLDREMAALVPWKWEEIKGTNVRDLDVKVTGRLVRARGGA